MRSIVSWLCSDATFAAFQYLIFRHDRSCILVISTRRKYIVLRLSKMKIDAYLFILICLAVETLFPFSGAADATEWHSSSSSGPSLQAQPSEGDHANGPMDHSSTFYTLSRMRGFPIPSSIQDEWHEPGSPISVQVRETQPVHDSTKFRILEFLRSTQQFAEAMAHINPIAVLPVNHFAEGTSLGVHYHWLYWPPRETYMAIAVTGAISWSELSDGLKSLISLEMRRKNITVQAGLISYSNPSGLRRCLGQIFLLKRSLH
jgi:hypothetical protein